MGHILNFDGGVLLHQMFGFTHPNGSQIFREALLRLLLEKLTEVGITHIDCSGYIFHMDILIIMLLHIA